MFYIDCYETKQGGIMENRIVTSPDEVLDIHKAGVKQGFVAGVIFCIVVKHLHTRRKQYQDAIWRTRQNLRT